MRETEIIRRIRLASRANFQHAAVIQGIGDDCAVVRPGRADDLVFTTDFVLEDRHFTLKTHSAAAIGHKALARSLSDLAAMGAEPVFCLVSLAVPGKLGGAFVDGFYKGLLRLANRHSITLAGGDLASFPQVIADVMCCGRVPRGKAVLRSGAKAGHAIYVTGSLGGAARAFEESRSKVFVPRLEAGLALRELGISAAIDLSDGLSLDLARLCEESKVSASLSNLPMARLATREQALHGGEDYELLFTAAPKIDVPRMVGKLRISRIGVITRGQPSRVFWEGNPIESKGFDHFL